MSILKHSQRLIVTAALAATLLTGCALSAGDAPETTTDVIALNPAEPVPAKVEAAPSVEAAAGAIAGTDYDDAVGDGAPAFESESMAAVAPAADGPAAETRSAAGSEFAPQQAPPLRAGEVDDNTQWDDYLLYRRNYSGLPVHHRDISERYVIEVTDGQGVPLLGASVSVSLPDQRQQEIFSAVTPASGKVLFHPLALDLPLGQVDSFQVDVAAGDASRQFTLTRFEAQPATNFTDVWPVVLNSGKRPDESLNLDVLFLVDATGSMADEIAKVQTTIFDVSARIDALPENPNVRYGLVTYRDRGDSFVTRSYDFTPDVRDFSRNLDTVRADGGGDYPESLNEGLHHALHSVEWRGPNSVKLIFLMADAPPHLDYAQDYDYAVEMDAAAWRGIKIFPIASSGLDDQGEYIFRQMAQYTQGRFIFLTYADASNGGAPGDVTTHHVDDYSVDNLDNLLVRLVTDELAHQNRQMGQRQ
jgi:Mg-chelatase subunit ChlD